MTTARSKKKKYGSIELERDFGPLSFAELLVSYREGEELSQNEVAKKLGVSKQRLCDFEKGRRLPSLRSAYEFGKKLARHPETWVLIVIEDMLRRENLDIKISVAG